MTKFKISYYRSIPPGRNNWGHWGSIPVENATASWILVGSNSDTTVLKKQKMFRDLIFSFMMYSVLIFVFLFLWDLSCSYIFTADPRGTLKLWRLCADFQSFPRNVGECSNVSFIAEFTSSFGTRIMCLDASLQDEVYD